MNSLSDDQLSALPLLPQDTEGPVFAEPWQAQAFALTLTLFDAGCFTWKEWAGALSRAITAAQEAGDPDLGDTYYHHWLSALEVLLHEKGIASRQEQRRRGDDWRHAAAHATHGEPIELPGKQE